MGNAPLPSTRTLTGTIWKCEQTRAAYVVMGTCHLEADNTLAVLYQATTGTGPLWCRPMVEFTDGRFAPVDVTAPAPPALGATGDEGRALISAREAAARLGMAKSTFWGAVRSGIIPQPIKFGPSTSRWRISEIEEVIEAAARRRREGG